MAKMKIFRTFTGNLAKLFQNITCYEISQESFSRCFPLFSDFSEIVRKLTKNFPQNGKDGGILLKEAYFGASGLSAAPALLSVSNVMSQKL